MSWLRARSSVGVLVVGLGLALAPVVSSPATATTKHKAKVIHHTAAPKTGGTCTALNGEQTQSSKLATTLEQAFASGKFATIKTAVLASFTHLGTDVAAEKKLLGSAPANVKTAFGQVASVFNQLKSQIAASTSLTQLEAAFTTLGTNPQLTSASKILSAYYGSKCGTVTPAT